MSHRIDQEGREARQSRFDQARTRTAYGWFSSYVSEKSLKALSPQVPKLGRANCTRPVQTDSIRTLRRLIRCSFAAEVPRYTRRLAGHPSHCNPRPPIPFVGWRYTLRQAQISVLRAYLQGSPNDLMTCRMRLHRGCARYGNLRPFRHVSYTSLLRADRALPASYFTLSRRAAEASMNDSITERKRDHHGKAINLR